MISSIGAHRNAALQMLCRSNSEIKSSPRKHWNTPTKIGPRISLIMLLWVQSFWPFRAPPECLSSFPHGKSATLRGPCGRASRELGARLTQLTQPSASPSKHRPNQPQDIARYREISRDPFPMTGRNMAKLSTKRSTLTNSKSTNTKLEAPKVQFDPIRHFACGTVAQDTMIVQPTMMEMPSTKKLIRHDTTNQNRSTYRIGQHSIPKTSMVEVQHVAMHHPFDHLGSRPWASAWKCCTLMVRMISTVLALSRGFPRPLVVLHALL